MQITVATYNIHKGVGRDKVCDPERIMSVLSEIDADVVALQEADARFGERATILPRAMLGEHHWQIASVARRQRSIGWHGNALLVKRGIEITDCEALELPTLEPRGAVHATLTHGGKSFCITGTHLDLSGLRRRAQLKELLAHLKRRDRQCPALIVGDFNQWGLNSGAMKIFADSWQMIAPGPSFPSQRPIARLDRIMATEGWSLSQTRVHHSALASMASDHLPVVAKLKLLN
ncbi:endonuclease/exonuclease/phosphatase family protein [Qipengyuania atrilutea]|uniref:Endonuclease/exonuclease/phosphatase family protein n=1 Tax=Qipengyuania atrilutea TaxID=2744473 RepID=A0A850H1T0_9SPHN|nr:endonuclease/exonuclease/phosphatase family protein [Actirhodobacter atriluteus]NVD44646.1 endonuclease/exonuclease/phosphatase family protein [Actirhodobacter atriluteus]